MDRAAPPSEGGGGGGQDQEKKDANDQRRDLPRGAFPGQGWWSVHGYGYINIDSWIWHAFASGSTNFLLCYPIECTRGGINPVNTREMVDIFGLRV